jgi:glutathione S-transferase
MKLLYHALSSSSRRVTMVASIGGDPDPDQVKRHEAQFNQFAAVLDGHLAKLGSGERAGGRSPGGPPPSSGARTWMVGNDLTIADIAIATPLMMTRLARLPVRPYGNVQAWFARVQELPAWKATEPPPLG